MKEYVYGTDQQYEGLKKLLEDHCCHVQNNCVYPRCCDKRTGRMGFEKEENTYALFIDKGITCSNKAPALFRQWISSGTLRFLEFTDMKEFLRSLKSLF